jgi:elongation factor Ts
MHIAAMKPQAMTKEEIDPQTVAKEREFLLEQARKEGKPEAFLEKMVEGRLRNFFAERALLEQPYVKDDKQTVGKYAQSQGLTPLKYVHWVLGQ